MYRKNTVFLKNKITEGSSLSQSHLTQPSPHSDCSSSAKALLEKCWQGILQPYSGLANVYIVHTRKIFPALMQIKQIYSRNAVLPLITVSTHACTIFVQNSQTG